MGIYKERYSPRKAGVNSVTVIHGDQLGGFLPATSGTITITYTDGTALIENVPVTAGVYLPLPFLLVDNKGAIGGRLVTADGASGLVGV